MADETLWKAEPHTIAKHRVLRAYLEAWFPILARYNGRIIYHDGFAGPGRYAGGEEGSPLIALTVARDHRAKLDSEIVFFFVEREADRADHLRTEIAKLKLPRHFHVEVVVTEFEKALRDTMDSLEGAGETIAPTFAFVDPFGIKGLPFELIARLLRQERCEAFITFMNTTVTRFVTELPNHVNALIGDEQAADIIAKSADRLIDARRLYERSLRRVARFVRFFEMRNQKNVPIYDLFFATNNDLGHYKMKEAMWKVDEGGEFSFSDGVDPKQATLFGPRADHDLAPGLLAKFRGRTVDAAEVLTFTRDKTPYLEKHARGALKLLERAGVNGARVTVAEKKVDGARRKAGTFPEGTLIRFPS